MLRIAVSTPVGSETHEADGYSLEAEGALTLFWLGRNSAVSRQVTFAAGQWIRVEQVWIEKE